MAWRFGATGRIRRAGGRILAAAIVGALAAVILPAPAQAAPLPLEYSTDGVTYSAAKPSTVFGAPVLVPGGTVTGDLWLRSTASGPLALTVVLSNPSAVDPLFAANLTLSSTSDAGLGLAPTTLAALEDCSIVSPRTVIAPGGVVHLTITALLPSTLTGLDAQNAIGSFALIAGMSDPTVSVGVAGCGAAAAIATTGVAAFEPLVWAAALLVGGALFVVLAIRRRRREDDA